MSLRYHNKVVIVTGGSKGIGRGIVRAFVENGAKVVFCARGGPAGEALEEELNSAGPGSCKFIKCDMSKEEEIKALHARLVQTLPFSFGSLRLASSFKAADLTIERNPACKPKPDPSTLLFGKQFSDHMLTISWSEKGGWEAPEIKPFQNLSLHPATSALHYSIELFEGMKAFRGFDNHIRLFRPMLNMERMHRSAERSCLPLFDKNELLECIKKLVEVDQEWVPYSQTASLYIRPTFIGTEPSLGVARPGKAMIFVIVGPVGPYFATGSFNPVSLLADPSFVRAWKGGVGAYKMGGNYGPTIAVQNEAQKRGCQQVLWLYEEEEQITEVGTMNLFIYWTNTKGERELVTPPLDGIILPGVTRQSLLDLSRSWGEFKVTECTVNMKELLDALDAGRVLEMFGAGTACVVCPVGSLLYKGKTYQIPTMQNGPDLAKRFYTELTDIQYGRTPSDWAPVVA
uniref:Branched-chain-amino-acid aminotransferase n=2 Tax=Nothobranchius furzeri TaxID=105023 RepID=A0A8C6KGV8_NOTFU|nr:branched-chain-amino-acid aminotransferase, cytosolic isoform X2 [Nothobranchius furzeri]